MAEVSIPVRFEDMQALRDDPHLPPELHAVLADAKRTITLAHGYEVELSEAEALKLRAHAEAYTLRQLAEVIRVELNGLASKRRPTNG